jgi:hypothetical protein
VLRKMCVLAIFAICLSFVQLSSAQLQSSLKLVSNDANAIAFVKVESIYATPLAAREKWIEDSEVRYANSPLFFPTSIKSAIMAAQVDVVHGSVLWEESYLIVKSGINMEIVAKNTNGYLEQLGGFESVNTGAGGTLLKLNENTLATKFPPNRQLTSRWAKQVASGNTGQLSEYLMEVADLAMNKSDAEIILGIDLQDAVGAQRIEGQLQGANWKSEVVDLVRVLTSIRGTTLEVHLKNTAEGTLTIDFAENIEAISDDAKTIVIGALSEKGLYIDDLDDWSIQAAGKQITFQGALSAGGLRRVASLIEPPRAPISENEMDIKSAAADAKETAGLRTQQHHAAVQALLKDIRRYRPKTPNALASYFERYARKIDNLPILHVDDVELEYALQVSNILRAVATGRRDTTARAAAIGKQNAQLDHIYCWGGNCWYYGGRSRDSASEAAAADIIAANVTNKSELMNELDKLSATVRQILTDKYAEFQIEF